MAKQNGPFQLTGTLGDVTFYFRKGEYLAKQKGGGFNTNAIKNHPNYVRVRENASEFGGCTKAAKFFRHSFGHYLGRPFATDLCPRTVKLMTDIMKCDVVSVRGARKPHLGIVPAEGKKLLEGFEMNPASPMDRLLKAHYVLDSATGRLHFDTLNTADIIFPKGATTAGLMLQAISFDFKSESAYEVSPVSFVENNASTGSLTLTVNLPAMVHEPEDASILFFVLHLRFYQEVNGAFFVFNDEKAAGMKVVC